MASKHVPRLAFLLLPLLTLVLGVQLGIAYERQHPTSAGTSAVATTGSGVVIGDPQTQVNIGELWDVWRLLQKNYIDPSELKQSALVYGAIGGLVRGIGDPYTMFMPPKENTSFKNDLQGKLEGIGAELTQKNGLVTIVAPMKGSPAEKAGLLAGDIITNVDGAHIEGMTLDDIVAKIRGPKGTTVTLTVVRQGKLEPMTVTITRAEITVPTVESKILTTSGGLLGYVALNQFGENSTKEFRAALDSFQGKTLKGLIVDLRFNGGGYLDGAVDIASMFLKEGEIVTVQNRGGGLEKHVASGHPIFPDIPLVILVNQGSASASEILAGALQDDKRATIIGMKTFGKGTVQEVLDLADGSSLRVTIARWLTPKGKNLGKEGVQPDIVIERTATDLQTGKDSQLQAATDWLIEKKDDSKLAKSSSSSSSLSSVSSTKP